MRARIEVTDDVGRAGAERLVAAVEQGGHVCLSGGSTPARAYELAAGLAPDWERATLWFGDERCVPPEDERSNHLMASRRLGGAAARLERMRGELGPDDGARDYERRLRDALGPGLPRLDLALMGLGPDGHTASLFPGQPSLEERERACVGVQRAGMEPLVPRITLTLPVFDAARAVVFLVAGEDKAEAMARAFGGEPSPATPASLVAPADGELLVLCDAAAAARLKEGG